MRDVLMVGENEGRVLAARLRAGGIGVVRVETNTGIQEAALDGLRCARGKERTMIAASGEKVWAALALAARMNVDRLALINPCPAECAETRKMQFFAMRNLFFCVSDVLVIERGDGRAFDRTVKRLFQFARLADDRRDGSGNHGLDGRISEMRRFF